MQLTRNTIFLLLDFPFTSATISRVRLVGSFSFYGSENSSRAETKSKQKSLLSTAPTSQQIERSGQKRDHFCMERCPDIPLHWSILFFPFVIMKLVNIALVVNFVVHPAIITAQTPPAFMKSLVVKGERSDLSCTKLPWSWDRTCSPDWIVCGDASFN